MRMSNDDWGARAFRVPMSLLCGSEKSADDSGRYSSKPLGDCNVRSPERVHYYRGDFISAEDSGRYSTATLLNAIESNNFASVRPLVWAGDQSCTHRILTHVLPFGRIAFAGPQQTIMKARLPKRTQLVASPLGRLFARLGRNLSEVPFQTFDPRAQLDLATDTNADKQMNVIGHDHVVPHANAELRGSPAILNETGVNCRCRKQRHAEVRVESNEIHWRVESLKNNAQPRWLRLRDTLHIKRSSAVASLIQCCSMRSPESVCFFACAGVKSAEESGRYSATPTEGCSVRSPERTAVPRAAVKSAEDSGRYSNLRPNQS
jgi:hypothetical protein